MVFAHTSFSPHIGVVSSERKMSSKRFVQVRQQFRSHLANLVLNAFEADSAHLFGLRLRISIESARANRRNTWRGYTRDEFVVTGTTATPPRPSRSATRWTPSLLTITAG
jgi:hypothetical protein